ncbi:MAG: hypothetical protein V9G98_27720 [Candidatus Competibacter sp.]
MVYKGIKITTEISTETTTTTPNPSASTEHAAEPKPVERGGRGVQDQNLKFQDSDQELVTLATTKQNPVSQEEIPDGSRPRQESSETTQRKLKNLVASAEEVEAQRPELTYPAKLTEREREDIAAQIGTLPPKTAQQMLDVIEAKRQRRSDQDQPRCCVTWVSCANTGPIPATLRSIARIRESPRFATAAPSSKRSSERKRNGDNGSAKLHGSHPPPAKWPTAH